MTLDDKLRQKLAEWRPPAGRQELLVSDNDSGWTANLSVDRCDEVGSLIWELHLRPGQRATTGDLARWANQIVTRVTGLLEPLAVVEIDTPGQMAQLRSQKPLQRGHKLFYYEVLLEGTRAATVRRFEGRPPGTHKRKQIPFALTHEALAKLVHDLISFP